MRKYLSLEKLVYITIFLLPTYLLRVRFLFLSTNVLEILMGAAILWWLLFFCRKGKISFVYANYKKYIVCSGIMLVGLLSSAFLHEKTWQSLGVIKSWFLIPMIFMLIGADIVPKEKLKNIFKAYKWSALGVAIISLGYLFSGNVTYDGRLQTFFNSPNYLAMYLAPGILIVFWERLFLQARMRITLWEMGIILATLFFTSSYAAFGATFLGLVMMLWFGRTVMRKHNFAQMIFAIAFILLLFLSLQFKTEKFNSLATLNPRSSLSSRFMIWRSAIRMIKDNPASGIGAANFQENYLAYQKFYPPYLEWAVPHPQNLYLDWWLSGGFLGLGGFFGLVFFLFMDLTKNKNQEVLGFLVGGIMVYILAHGFFDTTYFKNDLAVVFWLNFLALKK